MAEVLRLSEFTQVQLAKELGCGQATITDILHGHTKTPNANVALALILIGRQFGLSDLLQEANSSEVV